MILKKPFFPAALLGFLTLTASLFADRPPESEGKHFIEKQMHSVEGIDLTLIPEFSMRGEILRELAEFDPELSTELLFHMPMPDLPRDGSGVSPEGMLKLLNSMSELSSLEGVKYYSWNADAMITFIEECAVVDRRFSRTPLPDPVFETIPAEESYIFYQKDTTFGSNWYDITFRTAPDAIRLTMINSTVMWYKIIPAMGSGDVKIDIVIIPGRDELLFYSLSLVKNNIKKVFNKNIHLDGVFEHRLSAMQGWFADRIYGVK